MSARIRFGLLASLLLSLAPGAGLAYDWEGRVGLLYDRVDVWSEGGGHTSLPTLDLDLSAALQGSIVEPGVFSWKLGGAYRRDSQSFNGSRLRLTEAFAYDFDAALFRNPTTPVSLQLFARRDDSTFKSYSGTTVAGSRTSDTYGTTLSITPAGLPVLEASYVRNTREEDLPDLGRHDATTDRLTARYRQSAPTFNSFGTFTAEWNDGSWVYDKNRNYSVQAEAQAPVGATGALYVSDSYYHRTPTTSLTGAFSQDLNSFVGGYRSGQEPGDKTMLRFANRHGLASSALATTESTTNALDYFQDFRVGDEGNYVEAVANGSMNDLRTTAAGRTSSSGATVGADFAIRRATERSRYWWELAAGPRVGYVASDTTGDDLGYGANGRAGISTNLGGYNLSALYHVIYRNNLQGLAGWLLEQQGTAFVEGQVGDGRATANLSLIGRRGRSALGAEGVQSLLAQANYRWSGYTVYTGLTLSRGILQGTPNDFVGDGFFLPIGYDSKALGVTLGGNVRIGSALAFGLEGRYSSSSGPGQPDLESAQWIGTVSYRLGLFELSIENRLTAKTFDPSTATDNIFMLRASRTFGNQY